MGTGIIEWGRLYRDALPAIWEARENADYYGDLSIYRVNDIKEHDPKNYYYVWIVRDLTS